MSMSLMNRLTRATGSAPSSCGSNITRPPGASINVYSNILDRIRAQSKDRNLDARIAEFADGLYKEGVARGFGDEEVVALIKLLRR